MNNGIKEYKSGYPNKPGWYDCLIDGEAFRLKFYICQLSMKPHWIDRHGDYVIDEVRWTGEPSQSYER